MEAAKTILTCDCGRKYKRIIQAPDDVQDMREAKSEGICDVCWLAALVAMREPGA